MDLAGAVVTSAGQPAITRVARITAVDPIKVELDEVPLDPAAVGCVSSYVPRAGDTVALVGQAVDGSGTSASSWLIVGASVNSGSGAFSHNGIQIMASVQSENLGVFTDITGLTFPFTKRRNGSLIHARLAGSSFASAIGGGGEYTARILADGVQVAEEVLASFFYNLANNHGSWMGFDDIPNIPAGSYTIQGRFRRYTGGGAIQFDNNDRLSLYFDEV